MLPLSEIPSHGYPDTASPYVLHRVASLQKAEFVRPQGFVDRCGPALSLDGQLMVLGMKE